MNILVTGGAGFIGSHIVDRLIEHGYNVVVLDDLSTGSFDNLPAGDLLKEKKIVHYPVMCGCVPFVESCQDIAYPHNCLCGGIKTKEAQVEFIHGDIATFDFDTLGKIDVIFNLAYRARIQPSIIDPVEAHRTNALGALRVFNFARKNDIPVVHSSSSSIYGLEEELEDSIDETAGIHIKSPYALQKWTNEHYLELFAKLYGLKSIALRYFNVYGERQLVSGPYSTVIGIFLDQYEKGKPFTIVGDGEQRRDFTYVKDVVDANIKAMNFLIAPNNNLPDFDVFNIGTETNYSINELADLIDPDHPSETLEERPGEARETLANNSKACRELGWKPKTNLKDWIASQVNQSSG